MEQPKDVKFDTSRFCVKKYRIPPLKQASVFSRFLAAQVNTLYAMMKLIYITE